MEAEVESRAFMNDPDMRDFRAREDNDRHDEIEAERRANCDEPPHGVNEKDNVCPRCKTVMCPDGCCCAC
jgi:hypothetical protein